jgi:hypothetical protein
MWKITIKNDPGFCGKDAAETPFVNGQAVVSDLRIAEWFAARPDIYGVEKIPDQEKTKSKKQDG